jgi:hypothetical protein
MAARLTRKFISVRPDEICTTTGGMQMWRPASRLPYLAGGEIAEASDASASEKNPTLISMSKLRRSYREQTPP